MNETYVTFQGWLGSDVSERQVGEAVVATFRVASTPRRWSRRDRTWADGDTTWYTVNAWRGLGEHCIASLRRSDPVVVTGRLTTQVWRDNDGSERLSLLVEAVSVGHDLAKGTSTFTKAPRRNFMFRYRSPRHWLDTFRTYYGPMHKAFAALDAGKQESLAEDLLGLAQRFNSATDGSMVAPSEYLEAVIRLR